MSSIFSKSHHVTSIRLRFNRQTFYFNIDHSHRETAIITGYQETAIIAGAAVIITGRQETAIVAEEATIIAERQETAIVAEEATIITECQETAIIAGSDGRLLGKLSDLKLVEHAFFTLLIHLGVQKEHH